MLQLKQLEYAVNHLGRERDIYSKYSNNGVFLWVHPLWGAFADMSRSFHGYDDSNRWVENHVKGQLIKGLSKKNYRNFLDYYSRGLFYLNDLILFSAMRETSPLVLMALPGKYGVNLYYAKNKNWRFSHEYEYCISTTTNNQDSFLVFETKAYNEGSISKTEGTSVSTILSALGNGEMFIVGGNMGQCLATFLKCVRNYVSEEINITAISDFIHAPWTYLFYRQKFPDGGSLEDSESLIQIVKKEIEKDKKSIEKLTFEELVRFLYSFKELNEKIYPTEGCYWGGNKRKVPDSIRRARDIDYSETLKEFLNIVSICSS